ncbi:alpha/beta fold hydrolase [Variovorax terrae]|uniref:Alpha/beta hydrolase n=1 Tax=Variovorax terrae TaxID=2923278 RepID=A0A9X1VZ65_9BURK|nr:alpha/beta hydrolase [Variovorax terrae]MCJ0765645.1 alpha/beta hydrolase [Variovorax terrae]
MTPPATTVPEPRHWVLLRGLSREARHWGQFPAQLQARLAPCAVTLLDLPGNGVHWPQRTPGQVDGLLAAARAELAGRGLAPPFGLVAMSLGGMVATAWAQQHGPELSRLVLINTSMRPFSGITERLRPAHWPRLARLVLRWREAAEVEDAIHRLTCRHTASRAQDLAEWLEIRRSAPVSAANALRQLWAAARFRAGAAAPACPTLVLSGRGDALVNPVCSQRIAAAWGCAHEQHPWAGHDLPHDDAGWTCEAIAHWLQTLPAPAAQPGLLSIP